MKRVSFLAGYTTKTKRPVSFTTRSGERVSFGARRQSQKRTTLSFLARNRR